MPYISKTRAKILRGYRDRKGLSIDAVVAETGVLKWTIDRVENPPIQACGTRWCAVMMADLEKLLECYGVSHEYYIQDCMASA